MTETPQTKASRRRLVRLAKWLGGLLVLGMVVLAVAATWLWHHQTEALNEVLARVPLPATARVKTVRTTPAHVTLHGITLHDPTTGRQWLKLDEVKWTPTWGDLPRGVLGSIQVKGGLLDLDRATFDSLTKSPVEQNSGSNTPAAILEKLALENIRVKVAASSSLPAFECSIDQHGTDIDLSDPLHPAVKSFKTVVRNVTIGDAKEVKMASLKVEGSMLADDGVLRITSVESRGGSVTASQALFAMIDQPKKAVADPAPSPVKGVEVGQVKLQDFELHSPKDQKLPAWWPRVKGKVNGTIKSLAWSESAGLKVGQQEMELSDVELKPPSGAGVVSLAKGRVALETDQNGNWHILGGELETPIIDWTPELESWLMPSQPAGAASKNTQASPGMVCLIDAFTIHDAALSLQRTPRISYEGHVHLDLQIAALKLHSKGASSPKLQRLAVRDLSMAEHSPSKAQPNDPFAGLEAGTLQLVADDWNASRGVAELTLEKPVIKIRHDNVSWFDN
ncbi:MAG: hypothetical protein JWO89_2103, partial [Verrucomicrobiaceae bacterium]|nr:hypothetical protein [Verrucomicrobiaceae bacterium]